MNNEKHYWTLPFGARTETGNVAPAKFFADRHTYQFSTPGVNGELFWLILNSVNNNFYPRLTTQETVLRETGVFQDGSTAVILKAPTKNWSIDFTMVGSDRKEYRLNRLRMGYIFSWNHCTASVPPGYEEVNEIFDISSRWGRPNPFTYTVVIDGISYHTDCFVQTIEPQSDNLNPDSFSSNLSVNLTSDDPWVYGDEITEIVSGQSAPPVATPVTFLNPGNEIQYSLDTFASVRTPFVAEVPLTLTPPGIIIYAFGIYEVDSGKFSRYQHANYPTGGWSIGGGNVTLRFDSVNRLFTSTTSTGVQTDFTLAASPQSQWGDFEFVPGYTYNLFLETDLNLNLDSTITYRPRWTGV